MSDIQLKITMQQRSKKNINHNEEQNNQLKLNKNVVDKVINAVKPYFIYSSS